MLSPSGTSSGLCSLQIAFNFLTILPVGYPSQASGLEQRRSLFWYPLVGLAIGVLLWLAGHVLLPDSNLGAGGLLVIWVILTGALHLDGIADCADGWMGGLGDRDKTLRIMRDPAVGAFAVIALILLLILKLLALITLLQQGALVALIAVPVIARMAPLFLYQTTAYVRREGIGVGLGIDQSDKTLLWLTYAGAVLLTLLLCGWAGLWLLGLAAMLCALIRRVAISRLGGFTGDVAGASIELVELVCCIALATILYD